MPTSSEAERRALWAALSMALLSGLGIALLLAAIVFGIRLAGGTPGSTPLAIVAAGLYAGGGWLFGRYRSHWHGGVGLVAVLPWLGVMLLMITQGESLAESWWMRFGLFAVLFSGLARLGHRSRQPDEPLHRTFE